MSPTGSWITRTMERPRLRLFCFPYAGGGASFFRLWRGNIASDVEVCPVYLPGREIRIGEPLFTDLTTLVNELSSIVQPYLDIPFAFFGYSMGTLISFELTRLLRRTGQPLPEHLFVAAHRAPHLPLRRKVLYHLPTSEFIEELHHFGGLSQTILKEEELMQLFLPILRADLQMCDTYRYATEEPLSCPITAFGGTEDNEVNTEELVAWREHTRASFMYHLFPGNHFFLPAHQQQVLQYIARDLAQVRC